MKKIISFSGGKDSTAMLLRMVELDYDFDEIVFADTGFEFPELYNYIKVIEKHIGRKITVLKPEKKLFEKWFYGKVTRGSNKGKTRGFPLEAFSCWWARESKLKPLSRFQKKASEIYVGIAYDEKHRVSKIDDRFKYPLIEWKWSEKDCIDYLNKKNLFNSLYVNFNRLGCWFCSKQSKLSLYVIYKNYPDLWDKLKWWDLESKRVSNRGIKIKYSIIELENDFKKGKIPKDIPKYKSLNDFGLVNRVFKWEQRGLNEY